ncbi:hypothetical protein BSZ35_18580 [Salinibacter sp. 10B]|uniref:CHASE2 domain-containing protein n=1 Tax=Salinibacter sp. 10B TaxID=1923971 RepID=UPI000CF45A3E|nr:CHASE2 domain-containing protein [Salinibacter sp. 10B]PQJ26932.1 hypothetical protein BSZ35_18580 [Salinibacter sp. 10B]
MLRQSWLPHSVVFGTALLLFALGWLRYGLPLEDEKLLVQVSSIIHGAIARAPEHAWDEFIFIDTAYDPMLVEAVDDEGFPIGERPITDRAELTALFRLLADTNVHRFVLCDILFLDPSPHDAALQDAIEGVRNLVIPYTLDASGTPVNLAVDAPRALAQYSQDGNTFVRFSLVDGDRATIPLHMHRVLHPSEPVLGLLRLPRFIPDLRLPVQAMPAPLPLGQLLSVLTDTTAVRHYFKDRIVVIGALGRNLDIHDTVLGPMPGPLVLANLYLALRHGDHVLSPWLLFFLWGALVGLTWYSLSWELGPSPQSTVQAERKQETGRMGTRSGFRAWLQKLGAEGIENTFWLVLISLATYFVFRFHLPVLLLAVLLTLFVEGVRHRHWFYRRGTAARVLLTRLLRSGRSGKEVSSENPLSELPPADGGEVRDVRTTEAESPDSRTPR